MSQIFRLPRQVPITAAGIPYPMARAYLYLTGTSTLASVFTDEALTISAANPIVADAAGVFPLRWHDETVVKKLTLNTAADVLIFSEDPAFDPSPTSVNSIAIKYDRTAAENAAGVTPTNYAIASHDACGFIYVERYGTAGDATALANARLVAKQSGDILWITPATYSTSTVFLIDSDLFQMHMERGAVISYTGTDAAIRFSACNNSAITGLGNIVCTNVAAYNVDFMPNASAHCLFNTAEFHTIQGAGRGAAFATNSNIGVHFDQYNAGGNKIVYYNKVTARRIIDVNTCVQFDAPNADSANGANANTVYDAMCDNYWKGVEYRAIENFAVNVQGYGAPGSGSDITYLHYITNGSFYNKAHGGGGEPGALSSPYYIASGCNYNALDVQCSNFAQNGTDLGDGNLINTGRDLYHMAVSTGDVLTENTNYRFGKVTTLNTSAGTITLRWRARNAANGYYTSGVATILCWNQGGVTVDKMSQVFQESDAAQPSQTRFIGVITSGNDIFFVFSVRNFGGANATTGLDIIVDCLGPEAHQTGPTVEAGALSARVEPAPYRRVAAVYSASMTIDASLASEFDITATNGTAFTINAPSNPIDAERITITIRNTSGGALGAVTWNAIFKMSAWTQPANANSRSIDFKYNGTNWVQIGQTGVDVPN